jgi:hypothetical protein
MCKSPFPYGDRHIETGSRFIQLPIWKRGFPFPIWWSPFPCFDSVMEI